MLIEKYLPRYDFNEKHSTVISALPEEIFPLAERLDFSRSALIRFLFRLRGIPTRMMTRERMLGSKFIELERIQNEEIIIGLIGQFWKPDGNLQDFKPAEFTGFTKENFVRAVWNFRLTEISASATLLETETRIECPDVSSRKKFSRYWFFIRPFSGMIRREILRIIRKEAERISEDNG